MASVGKRKKPTSLCPNPLFYQWLTEWRDDAASKGLKSQYNYAKALQSLKKYPLLLHSGKECKCLENFGEKTCKMLDDKLAEYVAQYGTTDPVPGVITAPFAQRHGKVRKPATSPSGGSRCPRPGTSRRNNRDGAGSVCFSVDSGSDEEPGLNAGRNVVRAVAGRQRRGREYRPQYRSGPYAILTTLLTHLQNTGIKSMSKKDLMRDAQPRAEKSFTMPDPGSRYTAWSSMGTLITKGYVIKTGSPASYSITAQGCELAQSLQEEDADNAADNRGVSEDRLRFTLGAGPQLHGLNAGLGFLGRGVRLDTQGRSRDLREGQHVLHVDNRDLGAAASGLTEPAATRLPSLDKADDDLENILDLTEDHSFDEYSARPYASYPAERAVHDISDEESLSGPSLTRRSETLAGGRAIHAMSSDDDSLPDINVRSDVQQPDVLARSSSIGVEFWYIDDGYQRVLQKDKATVLIDDEISIGFLCECRYEDLLMSGMRYKIDPARKTTGDCIFAYLHNDDCPEFANPPENKTQQSTSAQRPSSHKPAFSSAAFVVGDSDVTLEPSKVCAESKDRINKSCAPSLSDYEMIPLSERLKPPGCQKSWTGNAGKATVDHVVIESYPSPSMKPSTSAGSKSSRPSEKILNFKCLSDSGSFSGESQSQTGSHHVTSGIASLIQSGAPRHHVTSDIASLSGDSQSQTDSQDLTAETPSFILRPQTFDVILCVDNCEIFGGGSSSRKEMLVKELKKKKVPTATLR